MLIINRTERVATVYLMPSVPSCHHQLAKRVVKLGLHKAIICGISFSQVTDPDLIVQEAEGAAFEVPGAKQDGKFVSHDSTNSCACQFSGTRYFKGEQVCVSVVRVIKQLCVSVSVS